MKLSHSSLALALATPNRAPNPIHNPNPHRTPAPADTAEQPIENEKDED
jgi:hypothetical protein